MIRCNQEPPKCFYQLEKEHLYDYRSVVVCDSNVEWPLRISNNNMAIWCIDLALEAIVHTLNSFPSGAVKDTITRSYRAREGIYANVFEKGKEEMRIWQYYLFSRK